MPPGVPVAPGDEPPDLGGARAQEQDPTRDGTTVAVREERPELAIGEVEVASGRLSVARRLQPARKTLPFSSAQLATLDETLTVATRSTGLGFSVYLGDLGDDSRRRAEELLAGDPRGSDAVVVAVSPGQRVVEIVTGRDAHRRLPDRGAKLAVMSMVASFKEGDLAGGLISGVRMLADQAGPVPTER